ncbi:MAG: hypothetical protein ACKO2V_18105 [Snowella sp.]
MNDPIFTQLPENSELSLPTTQQNGNNSRLTVEDLHRIIETAIARYWAQGVKIQTQKDLTNLEKVNQVVNDFFQHQSTTFDVQNQTSFAILQGLYQEFTGNFSAALNHYQAAIAGYQQLQDKNQASSSALCVF